MNKKKHCLYLLAIFCLVILLIGCGGSDGGSSYVLSPDELEVATTVEAFANAVKNENLVQSMLLVDSTLKYITSSKLSGYVPFEIRLKNLFDQAVVDDFTITDIGPSMESEDLAMVRARLTLTYTVAGKPSTLLAEDIELRLERLNGKWGIIEFAAYSATRITAFPPEI